MKKVMIWLPRILAISLTIFISIFALDVFGEGYSLPDLLVALFMHLLPSLVLVLLIILAWKRSLIAGVLFLATGVVAGLFFHPSRMQMPINLWAASPLFLIGALFIVSSKLSLKN